MGLSSQCHDTLMKAGVVVWLCDSVVEGWGRLSLVRARKEIKSHLEREEGGICLGSVTPGKATVGNNGVSSTESSSK
jgi:hypothetical protein